MRLLTRLYGTTSLSQANSIHTQSQIGISTQNGISNSDAYFTCNTCNWYTRFVHIKVQVYSYPITPNFVSKIGMGLVAKGTYI